MAQIIRYVDPDVVGGAGDGTTWANAYSSLNAWEAAEQTDLDTANNYMTVYCRSSSGGDDTTGFTIDGWTTSATDYIEIIGSDFPSDGVLDTSKYILNITNDHTILINENYLRIHNLQVQSTVTGSTTALGLVVLTSLSGSSDIRIDSCIIHVISSSTNTVSGVYAGNSADITLKVYNTVIYDVVNGSQPEHHGIIAFNGTIDVYNCTVYNCRKGMTKAAGTFNAKNCAVGNCNNDFVGAFATIDYCCSDDGDGTNSQGPSGGNWANEFTTPGSDFSLLVGGNCVENGTDNPGSGLYSDDIVALARTSTWDIGAFEYDNTPPVSGNPAIMTTNTGFWGVTH